MQAGLEFQERSPCCPLGNTVRSGTGVPGNVDKFACPLERGFYTQKDVEIQYVLDYSDDQISIRER